MMFYHQSRFELCDQQRLVEEKKNSEESWSNDILSSKPIRVVSPTVADDVLSSKPVRVVSPTEVDDVLSSKSIRVGSKESTVAARREKPAKKVGLKRKELAKKSTLKGILTKEAADLQEA